MKYVKNGVLVMDLAFNCQIAVLDFKLGWNFWSYTFLTMYVFGTLSYVIFPRKISCGCQINKVKICNICIIEKANLFEILWKYKEGISTLLFFNLTETCLRRILKAYPRLLNKRNHNWFLTPLSFKELLSLIKDNFKIIR